MKNLESAILAAVFALGASQVYAEQFFPVEYAIKRPKEWQKRWTANPLLAYPADVVFDKKLQKILLREKGKTKYEEQIILPKEVDVQVIEKRYVQIKDRLCKDEPLTCLIWLDAFRAEGQRPFCYASDVVLRSDDRAYTLQEAIDVFTMRLLESEFKSKKVILLNDFCRITEDGSKPLLVWGPSRNGEYELTTGRHPYDISLIYNPNTGSIKPFKGWINEATEITLEGDIIVVTQTEKGKSLSKILGKLQLNFGNTDPNKSLRLIEY